MSVYDRWHKARPGPDDEPCREHSRGRNKLYPAADHGTGDRWQVRYRDDHGRQRKQSFDKRPAADAFDAKIKGQLAAGTFVDPAAGQITFREYAEQWRISRTHDIVTAQHIEAAFRLRVYPVIGDHRMRLMAQRPSIVQAWISGVQTHPNSVQQVIKGVSQVFTAAVEDGIIPRNPLTARSVQKPQRLVSEVTPWSAQQVDAMASQLPARLAAIPYLGAACGLRQGELFGLASADLDFLRRTVHVEVQLKYIRAGVVVFAPLKNRKVRDVPVPDRVLPVLSEHVKTHPPVPVTLPWLVPSGKPMTRNLLFTWPVGQAIIRQRFNKHWSKARRAVGIPEERGNGCHVLRHTAASTWLSAGVSLAKVSAYLGDTKETILSVYAHFLPSDDDRAREVMNTFFAGMSERSCAQNVPGGDVK